MHAAHLEAPVHRQLFRPTEAHPAPERSAYRAQERTPSRQRRQRRYPARGPRGTRTPDILGVNEALYQLSYRSIRGTSPAQASPTFAVPDPSLTILWRDSIVSRTFCIRQPGDWLPILLGQELQVSRCCSTVGAPAPCLHFQTSRDVGKSGHDESVSHPHHDRKWRGL